jgi:hypothetical protein
MRRALAAAALLAALAACTRDLDVPQQRTLAVTPSFTTVAPRETLPLHASGGAGAYRFAFAEGGQLSGPDAEIDATTGAYRAGRLGSALDVVELRDAAGSVVSAQVSVGARLAISPISTGTAPGGGITFTVSGGRAPYRFAFATNASGGLLDPTGVYTAGPAGDVADAVVVTDATNDPAASAVAEVRISSALRLYRGTTGAVAPLQQVVFAAFGGEPPYAFDLAANGSGGAIDAVTGIYGAGARGSTVDTVRVRDALGQATTMDVTVGPSLAVATPTGTLHPSTTVRLVASGGQGPYLFGFALFGNRSGGTVEAATGDYTPGPNSGALDQVLAVDAVGATTILSLPAVGPLTLAAGTGVMRCLAADLNGDGRDDAVLLDYTNFQVTSGWTLNQFTTLRMPAGAAPVVQTGWFDPAQGMDHVVVGDFEGTGHDLLAFFGASGFWTLVPDVSGNLGFGPTLPASSFSGLPAAGAPIAAAKVTGGTRFYTGATCGGGTGFYRFDWPTDAAAPTAASIACEPLGTTVTSAVTHLFATDMNRDGLVDLVWTEQTPGQPWTTGPVRWAAGNGAGFTIQPGIPFQVAGDLVQSHEEDVAVGPAGLYLRSGQNSQIGVTLLTRGSPPTWASGASWPYHPFAPFTSGIALRDPAADRLAAWDSYGDFVGIDVQGGVPTTVSILPGTGTLPTMALCGTFPDLDGDGVPDLIASMLLTDESLIRFGDGDGRFGRRFRFATDGVWAPAGADLTGDGIPDLVAATSTPGLRVLAGGKHQLAYGFETSAPGRIQAVAVGKIGPGATLGLLSVDESMNLYRSTLTGGAVGTPVLYRPFSRLPTVEGLVLADLDASDPRDDVFVVTRQGDAVHGFSYLFDAVMSGTTATAVFSQNILWQWSQCAYLPVGRTSVASLCTPGTRDAVVLGRSDRSGTSYPDPTTVTTFAGIAAPVTRSSLAAAGVLGNGRSQGVSAVFVFAPSSATTAVSASALFVDPPFVATVTPLPGITEPVTSASLGDVNGDGVPDLLVRAGNRLWTFAGTATGGTFVTPGTSTQVAGAVRGAVPLAGGPAGDGVVQSGGQIVILPNSGGTLP